MLFRFAATYLLVLSFLLFSCSTQSLDPGSDAIGDGVVAPELSPGDAGVDVPGRMDVPQIGDGAETSARPVSRTYNFRAIGGASMGANALRLHARRPGTFDFAAALGGYINPAYLQSMFSRFMFAGFCDRETILDHLDEINDPESTALDCSHPQLISPWEFPMDFNHWHADDSGGTWNRGFFYFAVKGLLMAQGNLFYYNPEHPLLPPGVPVAWAEPGDGAAKCAAPIKVGKPLNYNAEYNPDGEYDLVTFCDDTPPIPGGTSNPDYYDLAGNYDPNHEYTKPVHYLVAVDFNGNGKRDYHEPIVINATERFDDVGNDGCADDMEDGAGGCQGGGSGDDPNGDNHQIPGNPHGTELDGWHQESEPFEDMGLDGVAGTGDHGEGDGEFSMIPHLADAVVNGIVHWVDTAPVEELAAIDAFMDGGIRDGLHAAVGTYQIAAHWEARGEDVRYFGNYSGAADALHPSADTIDYTTVASKLKLSAEAVGKNYMVSYGSADATPEQIDAGDGKHVGTILQVLNRVAAYVFASLARWPDLEQGPCEGSFGTSGITSFYSEAMQNRYGFAYTLPPCYDADHPVGYPLVMVLPGQGMRASETSATGVIFNMLSMSGDLPRFIMVVPEGRCCAVNHDDGSRYCVYDENDDDGSLYDCLDPGCKGLHDECDVIQVPKNKLHEECSRGAFFSNNLSDNWGDLENAKLMRYEDVIFELVDYVDASFPIRKPKKVLLR